MNARARIRKGRRASKEILPQKLPNRYRISLHVDDEAVICAWGREYGFNTYLLNAQDDEWKEKILQCIKAIRKKEHPNRSETEAGTGIPDEKTGKEEDPT